MNKAIIKDIYYHGSEGFIIFYIITYIPTPIIIKIEHKSKIFHHPAGNFAGHTSFNVSILIDYFL